MLTATIYSFSKRANSLATPESLGGYTSLDVEISLKNDTSLESPTFVIGYDSSTYKLILHANYIKFDDNYYWIDDVISVRNSAVELICEKDVLATYREAILDTKAYIARSSSNGSKYIPDGYLLSRANRLCNIGGVTIDAFNSSGHSYIINVFGRGGFQNTYLLNDNQMINLIEQLNNDSILEQLKAYFTQNPFEFLLSSYIAPFNSYIGGGGVSTIRMGEIIVGEGTLLPNLPYSKNYTLPIHRNFTDFRNRSPYTTFQLYLPFVGEISLDSAKIGLANELTITLGINPKTGDVLYNVSVDRPSSSESTVQLGIYSGNCYAQLPIASTNRNISALTQGILQTVTSAALLPASGGMSAAGISSGVSGTLNTFHETNSIGGSISSNLGQISGVQAWIKCWSSDTSAGPQEITEILGNPCGDIFRIGDLTGYVQTNRFSINLPIHKGDIDKINQLMDGGVYIE